MAFLLEEQQPESLGQEPVGRGRTQHPHTRPSQGCSGLLGVVLLLWYKVGADTHIHAHACAHSDGEGSGGAGPAKGSVMVARVRVDRACRGLSDGGEGLGGTGPAEGSVMTSWSELVFAVSIVQRGEQG